LKVTMAHIPTMKDDIVVNSNPLLANYLPHKTSKPNIKKSNSDSKDKSASGSQSKKSGGPKPLNKKQTLLKTNIELRKKYERMVLEWQEILCDPVSEAVLGEAVGLLFRYQVENSIY